MIATVPEDAGTLVVVTDLDACLLDERTYSWAPARPAVEALRARGVPLVLSSSKTFAEIAPLAAELGGVRAVLAENGGALIEAAEPGGLVGLDWALAELGLGVVRPVLVDALDAIAAEVGATVRGFSTLSAAALAAMTDLPPAAAALALDRHYDEPFILVDGDPVALARAAAVRGLQITRGGRFHHLLGPNDKGAALRRLVERMAKRGPRPICVTLGDSPNDLTMLQAGERPVVVPRPDGRPDATLAAALPGAELAPAPGPEGWNRAVLAVLAGERLAIVGATPNVGGGEPQ